MERVHHLKEIDSRNCRKKNKLKVRFLDLNASTNCSPCTPQNTLIPATSRLTYLLGSQQLNAVSNAHGPTTNQMNMSIPVSLVSQNTEPNLHLKKRASSVPITYIIFTDDVLCFTRDNLKFISILASITADFSLLSGFQVNRLKSGIYLSKTCVAYDQLLTILGFPPKSLPMSYFWGFHSLGSNSLSRTVNHSLTS